MLCTSRPTARRGQFPARWSESAARSAATAGGISTKGSYSGLDGIGIGIGIAILDSGVERNPIAFRNESNQTRVLRNVNMLNTGEGQWSMRATFEPGSASQAAYDAAINNATATVQDGHGHGTHVASLVAGFTKFVRPSTPDITGLAPNANIYDVKVMSTLGVGTVSDAIEGIQWVNNSARALNIKVMNLSIAADSSDSWRVDPLCAAARRG